MMWKSGMDVVFGEGVLFGDMDSGVLYALNVGHRVADKRCDVAVMSLGSDRTNVVLELLEVTMAELDEGLRHDPTMWLRDFPEGFRMIHGAVYSLDDVTAFDKSGNSTLDEILANWVDVIEYVYSSTVNTN